MNKDENNPTRAPQTVPTKPTTETIELSHDSLESIAGGKTYVRTRSNTT